MNKLRICYFKRTSFAFTLIELLIVIAILGILVALILPRFADVRDDANTKVCVANLRGLVSAMNTYEVKENVVSTWNWATDAANGTADLETWGYLADEPSCPVGGTYSLAGVAGSATATCSEGSPHVWP